MVPLFLKETNSQVESLNEHFRPECLKHFQHQNGSFGAPKFSKSLKQECVEAHGRQVWSETTDRNIQSTFFPGKFLAKRREKLREEDFERVEEFDRTFASSKLGTPISNAKLQTGPYTLCSTQLVDLSHVSMGFLGVFNFFAISLNNRVTLTVYP